MRRVLFFICVLAFISPAAAQTVRGWTHTGNIEHENVQKQIDGNIIIDGKIDGGSQVSLRSNHGSIVIHGKIDGASTVTLWARKNIAIGTEGDPGDRKIDGGSAVYAEAGGIFRLGNKIDKGYPFPADKTTWVHVIAGQGIYVGDKIDGYSHVEFCTKAGQINIRGKIDGPGVPGAGPGGRATLSYWPLGSLKVGDGIRRRGIVRTDASACQPEPGSFPWTDSPF